MEEREGKAVSFQWSLHRQTLIRSVPPDDAGLISGDSAPAVPPNGVGEEKTSFTVETSYPAQEVRMDVAFCICVFLLYTRAS